MRTWTFLIASAHDAALWVQGVGFLTPAGDGHLHLLVAKDSARCVGFKKKKKSSWAFCLQLFWLAASCFINLGREAGEPGGAASPAPLRPAAGSICSWGWCRDLWPESCIRGPLLLLHGSWCEWQWKNKPFFSLTSGKRLPRPPPTHTSQVFHAGCSSQTCGTSPKI